MADKPKIDPDLGLVAGKDEHPADEHIRHMQAAIKYMTAIKRQQLEQDVGDRPGNPVNPMGNSGVSPLGGQAK